MHKTITTIRNRKQRAKRVRVKIHEVSNRPRLSVFRSNKHIEGQIIDDALGKTLAAIHDRECKSVKAEKGQSINIAKAYTAGKMLAERAKAKKVTNVVFDRRKALYHGRVAAFAKGARDGGLQF